MVGDLSRLYQHNRQFRGTAFPFESIETLTLMTGAWLPIVGYLEVISGFVLRGDATTTAGTMAAMGR